MQDDRGENMREIGLSLKTLIIIFLALCWGCSSPVRKPVDPVAGLPAQTMKADETVGGLYSEASKEESCAGFVPVSTPPATVLQTVQLNETSGEIVLRLTGSAPLYDYHIDRDGRKGFRLEVDGVDGGAPLPALPADSRALRLAYDTGAGSGVVWVRGMLSSPLDHYVVSSVDNDLVVTLYPVSRGVASAGAFAAMDEERLPAKPREVVASGAVRGVRPVPKIPDTAAVGKGSGSERSVILPPKKEYFGPEISLDVVDADIRNILRLLGELSKKDIIIDPDVAGRVTMKVDKVKCGRILETVVTMNGLDFEQEDNLIRVARQDKLKQENDRRAQMRKSKQEFLETNNDLGEMTTAFLTVNYAVPKDVMDKLTQLKSDKGKIAVDDRTSLIIYTDYPARIENARQLLARIDKSSPQVLIEARIVEVTANASHSLGATLNFNLSRSSSGHTIGTDTTSLSSQGFQVSHPVAGDLFSFGLAQLTGSTLWNIDMQLSALETVHEANVVGAPKVLTLDNVKAVITQGSQIPYLVLNTNGVSSTTFQDATVELQVTPHITPDQKIKMAVQAKQDDPTIVTGATQPGITTRKITTELLVDDGNIVVIGGVIRGTDSKDLNATPGLNKIPLLGALFRSNERSSNKTELLIFICPRIVGSANTAYGG